MWVPVLLAPAPLHARQAETPQDVGATTPPELREFRLDPSPPRPATEQNLPQEAPPPAPSAATTQPSATRSPNQRAPREQTSSENAGRSRVIAPQTTVPQTQSVESPSDERTTRIDFAPSHEFETSAETLPAQSTGEATNPWPWAFALMAFLGGVLLFIHRRIAQVRAPVEMQSVDQPSPPVRLKNSATQPSPPPSNPRAPAINAAFTPETAQLSIASLAVIGRLAIANKGNLPIENLTIRSQMISAQANQKDAIEAFHNAQNAGSIQHLDGLAVGETIDALIEIRLPRIELAAFRWTEREFIAPIVLVNISGQAGDQAVDLRLSHLIGRIGADGAARMKPLAVDRGPKRFTGVTAKPLFA